MPLFLAIPRWILLVAGAYATIGGVVSFAAWPLDVPRLAYWSGRGIATQPNTALAAAAAGVALLLLASGVRRAAAALGLVVALIGATALFEYASRVSLGIDSIFLFGRTWGRDATLAPGRMGLPASVSWTLAGTALALLGRRESPRAAPALGFVVAIIAALSLTGYLFGAQVLYSLPWLTAIAAQTSSMLLAVGLGIMAAVPERQPMRGLGEDSAAGTLVRRLLPFIVTVPIALGFVRVHAQEAGLVDTAMGTAVLVLALVVLLCGVLWWGAAAVRAHERDLAGAAAALAENDRRKDEFLALLAHELRNPLSAVRNAIAAASLDDTKRPRALEIARRQSEQLARLVDDLLDVARITQGRIALRHQRVRLADVIAHAIETTRPLVEERGLQLSTSTGDAAMWLEGDPARLEQVLVNLLSNAAKFTPPGGDVALEAARDGTHARLRVRDTGIGIPPEMLPRIWDLFAQGERGLDRAQGGLGIGLTVARRLIELHGGRIDAYSAGAGRGAEFIVRVPLAEGGAAADDAPSDRRQSAGHRPRADVLIVEDNTDAAESITMLLELLGHRVRAAHDGPAGIAEASSDPPDLMLVDIGLPGMDGYEVARRIRLDPSLADVVLIALTGYGRDDDRRRATAAGFDHHLVKPVDPDALADLVARLAPEAAGEETVVQSG